MTDLAGFSGMRIASKDAVDAVPKPANVHELETEGEEERAQNEPGDDDRKVDVLGAGLAPSDRRVVPEDQVEEDHVVDRSDDPVREEALRGGEETGGFGG